MKKIILIALIFLPWAVSAQRISIIDDEHGNKCFAIHAYGLPREVVKTNSEMRASIYTTDTDSEFPVGIVRRHHTTKGDEDKIGTDGYNANRKISFSFILAPHNINAQGEHSHTEDGEVDESQMYMTWLEASGWSSDIDNTIPSVNTDGTGNGVSVASTSPTGCAAYKGINGEDEPGTWRLPTQREAMVIFTVIEHGIIQNATNIVTDVHLVDGYYWTSTEFYADANDWKAYSVNNLDGSVTHQYRSGTSEAKLLTRCIKDIYYDINE